MHAKQAIGDTRFIRGDGTGIKGTNDMFSCWMRLVLNVAAGGATRVRPPFSQVLCSEILLPANVLTLQSFLTKVQTPTGM